MCIIIIKNKWAWIEYNIIDIEIIIKIELIKVERFISEEISEVSIKI